MAADLSTKYLGFALPSPFVASASPCTGQPDVLRRLEAAGASAAVLPSLFEEQVLPKVSHEWPAEAGSQLPFLDTYNRGAESYPKLVETARQAVSMPIIASLNGTTPRGWVALASQIESAGADALELNLHTVPVEPDRTAQQLESQLLEVVSAVRLRIRIPLAVKIGPYFSALPNFARQLSRAGADGLVLFNRFLEPNVNLERGTIDPYLELSQPSESRLSLRWLGILRDQRPELSLAASSGIHSGVDALKALAVGADVVMVTSALLIHGAEHLQTLREEMLEWLVRHDYASLQQLIGSMSRGRYGEPHVFERANYAATIASYMEHGARPN